MSRCKRSMIKQPYVKAFGISLIMHGILLALLVTRGYMIDPVSYATPIEVEFIPTSLLNIEQTLTDSKARAMDSSSVMNQSAVATSEKQSQRQIFPNGKSQIQQSFLPATQVRDTTTLESASAGVAATVVSANAASGNGDHHDMDKKVGGQEAKPIIQTKASHISGLRPAYPYDARHAGWEGTVVIRILVGTDGLPVTVAVHTSSGYRILDEAAAQGVKKWRFSPARQGDNPVESYYDVRVKFNLDDT